MEEKKPAEQPTAFKSKAQIQKFYDLNKQGKIGSETIAKWALNTRLDEIPERVPKEEDARM